MRRCPPGAFAAEALALALILLLPLASAGGATTTMAATAKAPAAPPPNITALMTKGGCAAFASLLSKSPDAESAFQSAAGGGVTAFCPSDAAVRAFAPRYRNLTADARASLLLFHAVPVYYTLRGLRSSNGPMNTLATDGGAASSFNLTVQNAGDQVTLRTPAGDGPARVRSTVYDRDPVAIYAVDAVLEPVELFDPAAGAPAPAPSGGASSSSSGKRARHQRRRGADAPGPAGDDDATPADQRKDSSKNAAAPTGAPCRPTWLAAVAVAVAAALAA